MINKFMRVACAVVLLLLLVQPVQAQLPHAANGKVITVGKSSIYYEESGQGQPLLLLHGFGRTTEDWKPYVAALSTSNRVIVIDLPGHGRSSLMDSTHIYRHREAAAIVLSFIDALKLKDIHVMGFSSGAIITLYLSTLRPGLTKKIVVAAGQLYFSDETRKFISSLAGPQNFVNNTADLAPLHGAYKGNLIAEQFYHFRKLYGDPSFTPDVLSTISAKALIIHGDDDPAAPVENAFALFRHIPQAHLWVIPYAEHIGIFSADNGAEVIKQVTGFFNR